MIEVGPHIDFVLAKLRWMREQKIWPNGLRYLWTDAFGVVLLVSLCKHLREQRYLDEAEWLVAEVTRVLGRRRGIRIGEAPDRDGQYFHYLAMWMFALARLGDLKLEYRHRGIQLARDIHKAFVVPDRGVIWKMQEDLSGLIQASGWALWTPSTAMSAIGSWTSKPWPPRFPRCDRSWIATMGAFQSTRTSVLV